MEKRNVFAFVRFFLVTLMMFNLVAGAGYNIVVPTATTPSSSSSGGGGSGGGVAGGALYVISDVQFDTGYQRTLVATDRIQFNVGTDAHTIKIDEISNTTNTIKITVNSTPQTATLSVGDVRKFELSGDNYYDLSVTLNSIVGNFADVTIKKISEEVTPETIAGEEEKEAEAAEVAARDKETKGMNWLYIVIGVVLVILVGWAIVNKRRGRENLFI